MPPWPGSSTTTNGPSPRTTGAGKSAASGRAQSASSGRSARAAKSAAVAGVSVTSTAVPFPVTIPARATTIGSDNSSTRRDQPGRNTPARRSTTCAALLASRSIPVQSTSRKSRMTRGGSFISRTRHGTGCDSPKRNTTFPPTSVSEDAAGSSRANPDKSCARAPKARHRSSTATQIARIPAPFFPLF
jgi:hypothetical protein